MSFDLTDPSGRRSAHGSARDIAEDNSYQIVKAYRMALEVGVVDPVVVLCDLTAPSGKTGAIELLGRKFVDGKMQEMMGGSAPRLGMPVVGAVSLADAKNWMTPRDARLAKRMLPIEDGLEMVAMLIFDGSGWHYRILGKR